jgi:hypothetical protein
VNSENPLITSALTDCFTAFVCPLGEFYPNKDYGSKIKQSIGKIDSQTLLCYARQAVSDMDGVYVKSVELSSLGADFTVMINDEERTVNIPIEQDL